MNDFNTKLVMEMLKQLLENPPVMNETCTNSSSTPQILIPNQLLFNNFPQHSSNLISNNYCIQTDSTCTFNHSNPTTTSRSIFPQQTCPNNSINSNTISSTTQVPISNTNQYSNHPINFLQSNSSNSNFEQLIPILFNHYCIESNIFSNGQIMNFEQNGNNQVMITQLVDLIDKIIYLNSVNSSLKQVMSNSKVDSNIVKNECNEVQLVQEELKSHMITTTIASPKEEYHSDSSHSSTLSNNKLISPICKDVKKRKRNQQVTDQSSIQQPQEESQKRKIPKHAPQTHSDLHSNVSVTASNVPPNFVHNNNNKELLLNQFCNYTVDTLKQKLSKTEKRGRGRPRKSDETSQPSNTNTNNTSFYTKSAFHHVHFNKQ